VILVPGEFLELCFIQRKHELGMKFAVKDTFDLISKLAFQYSEENSAVCPTLSTEKKKDKVE
jgi:hypothetical protein